MSLNRSGFFAVVLFLTILSRGAHAGLVTYDFVDRTADQNDGVTQYNVGGTITVKDTAISAGTLLTSDVVSFSVTVTHGGTTDFVLSDVGGLSFVNVSISSTDIFLPPLVPSGASAFNIHDISSSFGGIFWNSYLFVSPTASFPEQAYFAEGPSNSALWQSFHDSPNLISPFDIAVRQPTSATPVPSTLVMSSILFGMVGMVWSYKRFKQITAAA